MKEEEYHLGNLIHRQALRYRSKTALKFQYETTGTWNDMSWTEFSEKVMKTAQAMAEMGVKPHDNIGVYSQNMAKYLITDFAAYANRAVMVPICYSFSLTGDLYCERVTNKNNFCG